MRELILIGGGGHCKSVIDAAESAGYSIFGILDKQSEVGKKVLNYNVIGTDEDISKYVNNALFLVTVGQIKDVSLRIKLHQLVEQAGGKLATVIASTAHVSGYATVGDGTVIMHNAAVNAGVVIGKGCIINTFANIEHDVVVKDFCHISTGAMINGDAFIGEKTFIGSQAVVNQGIKIGGGEVIASLSAVNKDILVKGVYGGVPAKLIRRQI